MATSLMRDREIHARKKLLAAAVTYASARDEAVQASHAEFDEKSRQLAVAEGDLLRQAREWAIEKDEKERRGL